MKSPLVLFLLFCSFTLLLSQPNEVKTTKQVVDEERYFDFKGTPYYFKNWVVANLVQKDGVVNEGVLLNFNGFTQNFEINQQGKIAIVDESQYDKIVIEETANEDKKLFKDLPELIFRQGFHEKFYNKFAQVLYDGSQIKLLKEISSELTIKERASLGKIDEIKRFVNKEQYYILGKGKLLIPFRIKNNTVKRMFGQFSEEDISKMKAKTVDEEEIRALESYIEDIGGYVTKYQDLQYSEINYYLTIEQDLLIPINLSKRSILQVIGKENSAQVKTYLKKNNHQLNSATTIIEFLKYYEKQFLE